MSETIIRPAAEADVPAVREMALLAWTPIYEEFRRRLGDDIYRAIRPRGADAKPDEVERVFREDPGCMIVTELDGRVVAFATFFVVDRQGGIGEIGNNAVHPEFQGRGLGRQQYERVFAELKARGCRFVRVTTGLDDSHAPARRAYEAMGFERNLPSVTYYRDL